MKSSHQPSFQLKTPCTGFYFNNREYVTFAPGTLTDEANINNSCTSCPAETYRDAVGGIKYNACNRGTCQLQQGQASCDECFTGRYCAKDIAQALVYQILYVLKRQRVVLLGETKKVLIVLKGTGKVK